MNEEIKKKSKKCLYCGNYEGYYKKGLHRFESIKQGFCVKNNQIVSNKDCCEFWKTSSRRFYLRKKVASRALFEILMDISAIRQILQENQDEGENL